jgi:hypothetical protein
MSTRPEDHTVSDGSQEKGTFQLQDYDIANQPDHSVNLTDGAEVSSSLDGAELARALALTAKQQADLSRPHYQSHISFSACNTPVVRSGTESRRGEDIIFVCSRIQCVFVYVARF